MLRRSLAATVLALAALTGSGGVAVADPTPTPAPTPAPATSSVPAAPSPSPTTSLPKGKKCIRGSECITTGDDPPAPGEGPGVVAPDALANPCLRTPAPERPWSRAAGIIDRGPSVEDTATGFGTRGYGGYGLPIYDPGCNPLSPNVVQKRIWDGPTFLADTMFGASLLAQGVSSMAARYVLDEDDVWSLVDVAGVSAQTDLARRLLLYGSPIVALLVCLFLMWRARNDPDVPHTITKMGGMLGVVVLGSVLVTSAFVVGPAFDQAMSATFRGISGVASTGPWASRADVAVGEAVQSQVIRPMWESAMFGDDDAAKREFGWRLYAAQSMTRDEARQAAASPEAGQAMVKLKKQQFDEVAQAVRVKYPGTYEAHLAGSSTRDRIGPAVLALLGTVLATAPANIALAVIAFAKLVVRGVLVFLAVGAVALMLPRYQPVVVGVLGFAWTCIKAAAVAVVGYVLTMVFGIGMVLGYPMAYGAKLFVLGAGCLGLIVAWKHRKRLFTAAVAKTGRAKQVQRGMKTAAAVTQPVRDQAARVTGPVTRAATARQKHRGDVRARNRAQSAQQRADLRARVQDGAAERLAARRRGDKPGRSRRAGARWVQFRHDYRPNRHRGAPERRRAMPARAIARKGALKAAATVAAPTLKPALVVASRASSLKKVVKR